MSHFVVYVIGEVDKQLEQFHQFESTGYNEYVQDIDVLEEAKSSYPRGSNRSFLTWVRDEYDYEIINHNENPDLEKKHKYGYIVVNQRNNVLKVIKRTNPNYKWDWYKIGGRWNETLQLLNGNKSNIAQKCQIDWEKTKTPFAILYKNKWHQIGEMGWWGITHDEKDSDIWEKEVKEILKQVNDEELITVVDCHI